MIVIAKDAEEKLLEDLRAQQPETQAQRCYYMEFSKADVPKKELFEKFLTLLQDVPDAYRAQVYICQDHDVFVLMQGFMQRHFAEFLKKLAAGLGREELAGLSDVMEVRVHKDRLETMCRKKLAAVKEKHTKETETQRKAAADSATLAVLETLDPDLLSSVAQRRAERLSPLVMIVDDDQIARTLVGNVVREHYDWSWAKDGAGALGGYVAGAPDVLFLDIGLPDINGHDILETLFQIDPDAYIIMFSGRKDKENIMKALETGAQGFIGKPFTREKLYQYIERSPHLLARQKRENNHAHASG